MYVLCLLSLIISYPCSDTLELHKLKVVVATFRKWLYEPAAPVIIQEWVPGTHQNVISGLYPATVVFRQRCTECNQTQGMQMMGNSIVELSIILSHEVCIW